VKLPDAQSLQHAADLAPVQSLRLKTRLVRIGEGQPCLKHVSVIVNTLAFSLHEPAHAHLCIVAPILADFRAEVIWSANASLSQLHSATQHLGHSKITKFEQATSRHEYILRLDVSACSRVACV
jgi:hypothetical protein